MRTTIFIFLVFLFSEPANSQQSIHRFIQKHHNVQDATSFSVPGWSLRLGIDIADVFVQEPEFESIASIIGKIKSIRFFSVDTKHNIHQKDVEKLLAKLNHCSFEDLIKIRDGDSNISFLIKEKKEKIKRIVVIISEEDSFLLFSIKTNIKYSELADLSFDFMESESIDFPLSI